MILLKPEKRNFLQNVRVHQYWNRVDAGGQQTSTNKNDPLCTGFEEGAVSERATVRLS